MKTNSEFRNKNLRGAKIEDTIFWLHDMEKTSLEKAECSDDIFIKAIHTSRSNEYHMIKTKLINDFGYEFLFQSDDIPCIEVEIGIALVHFIAENTHLRDEIQNLRDNVFSRTGVQFPTVHIADNSNLPFKTMKISYREKVLAEKTFEDLNNINLSSIIISELHLYILEDLLAKN